MTDRRPLWLRTASVVYRVCSLLTPRSVRERFGPESQASFDRLIEDTLQRRGPRAAMTTVAAACGDVAHAGASDRFSDWSGAATGTTTDIAHSLRRFWREPILAVALMLTLAIVSGPTVATFNALYHLVLAPLPYPDAGRLVVVSQQTPTGAFHYLPTASVADYRNVKAFSTVGGMFPVGSVVGSDADAVRVQSCRATAGLLSGLGVPFVAGRDLVRGERGIVVTRGFALSRFGTEQASDRADRGPQSRADSDRRRRRVFAAAPGTRRASNCSIRTRTPIFRSRAVRGAGRRSRSPGSRTRAAAPKPSSRPKRSPPTCAPVSAAHR